MATATFIDQLIDPGERFDRSYVDVVQQAELAADSAISIREKAIATLDHPNKLPSILHAIPRVYLPHNSVIPHPARVL